MMRTLSILAAFALSAPAIAVADFVTPSNRVKSRVVVRDDGSRTGRELGSLRPGDRAEWLSTDGPWHHVLLSDGTRGWVSALWTRVTPEEAVPDASPARGPDIPPMRPGFFTRWWRRWFGGGPHVELVIEKPEPRQKVYRHRDPNLPVSGYATASGSHRYDVILVIDTSTSTNESAHTDVDGDGVSEDGWKSPDSVFHAQIEAGLKLVETVRRLPGNHSGERIRIGVVTFSGDESHQLDPEDEHVAHSAAWLYALARRDARLRVPLTGDYGAIRASLQRLSRSEPIGMTDFAAGISLATIELSGLVEWGAQSDPRPGAQKLILFLSDGDPRLPFDTEMAERTGVEAAKLADRSDIRVNTFVLGRNPVTREVNPSIKKMAARTGGHFVVPEYPGDIVQVLYATAFTFVESVKLFNETTDLETDYIATGIDGSFYGEIGLVEGDNEIEVVAHLFDGTEASETFHIEYQNGEPTLEQSERLGRIKRENESLIEQIKDELAKEIERVRVRRRSGPGPQDKNLDVRIEKTPQGKILEIQVEEDLPE
ncbi:MAG: hypothetical protein ACE5FL_09125 [Myxococcota bacterium]